MRGRHPKWIQQAHLKPGALSRQLGIPERENIPMGLLETIRSAPVGGHVRGPHGWIPITPLLKQRATVARNLKRM